VITDESAAVVQRLSYDPWGKQRNPNGSDAACGTITSPTTRGFTNQEEMPVQCLVNLNARLYNPSIGKFMAADSIVPDAYNGQALNRYTYVLNNPLSFTDPSGLIPESRFDWDPYSSYWYDAAVSSAQNPIDPSAWASVVQSSATTSASIDPAVAAPVGNESNTGATTGGSNKSIIDPSPNALALGNASGSNSLAATNAQGVDTIEQVVVSATRISGGGDFGDYIKGLGYGTVAGTNGSACLGCFQIADITVNDFYNEVGGAGHVGIGVNTNKTQGFYPKNESLGTKILEGLGINVPGVVKYDDLSQPHSSVTIHTTSEQDKAVQLYIDQTKANPGNYNLYQQNCAVFCEGAMRAGGVSAPTTIFPNRLFDIIEDMKQ
jgi:RHS repeat-associated protein